MVLPRILVRTGQANLLMVLTRILIRIGEADLLVNLPIILVRIGKTDLLGGPSWDTSKDMRSLFGQHSY